MVIRMDSKVYTHPSYGIIDIARHSLSKAKSFFGSSVKHLHGIELTISRGEMVRHGCKNFYSKTGDIIKVSLTETQMGMLMSTAGHGDVVPCTITHVSRQLSTDKPEEPPLVDELSMATSSATEAIKVVTATLKELHALTLELTAKTSPLTKKEKEQLVGHADRAASHLESNLSFIQHQFRESLEEMANDAASSVAMSLVMHSKTSFVAAAKLQSDNKEVLPDPPSEIQNPR